MKYSIIVATYNRGKDISKTLENLLLVNDCEVIVVNNGIENPTAVFQFQNDRVKNIVLKEKGVSNARNVGFGIAKGEWVFSFDDDDFLTDEYIEWLNNNNISTKKWNIYRFHVDVNQNGKYLKKHYKHVGKHLNNINKWYTCTSASYLIKNSWLKENKIIYPKNLFWGEDMVWDGTIRGTREPQKMVDISAFIYIRISSRNSASEPEVIDYKKMLSNVDGFDKFSLFKDNIGRGYLCYINLINKAVNRNDKTGAEYIKKELNKYILRYGKLKILKDMPPYDSFVFIKNLIIKKYKCILD